MLVVGNARDTQFLYGMAKNLSLKKAFLALTAALEVQMLVCVSVRHTCYNCTKALNFKVFRLKDL